MWKVRMGREDPFWRSVVEEGGIVHALSLAIDRSAIAHAHANPENSGHISCTADLLYEIREAVIRSLDVQ